MLDTYEVTVLVKGTVTAEKPTEALDKAKVLMANGGRGIRIEEVHVMRA